LLGIFRVVRPVCFSISTQRSSLSTGLIKKPLSQCCVIRLIRQWMHPVFLGQPLFFVVIHAHSGFVGVLIGCRRHLQKNHRIRPCWKIRSILPGLSGSQNIVNSHLLFCSKFLSSISASLNTEYVFNYHAAMDSIFGKYPVSSI